MIYQSSQGLTLPRLSCPVTNATPFFCGQLFHHLGAYSISSSVGNFDRPHPKGEAEVALWSKTFTPEPRTTRGRCKQNQVPSL
jgi:hypothetical protein